VVALAEVSLFACRPRFLDEVTLLYRHKMQRAADGHADQVLILGDSLAVAAIKPQLLEGAFEPGTLIYNYGMPALGPLGTRIVVRAFLEANPPPKLACLLYTPAVLANDPDEHLLRTGALRLFLSGRDTLEVARLTDRPYLALHWLGTRLAVVRYRESLMQAAVGALLGVAPGLTSVAHQWSGLGDDPVSTFKFQWRYTDRPERNRRYLEKLEADRGYHYFREREFAGGRFGDHEQFDIPRFDPSRLARSELDRLLSLLDAAGTTLFVLPAPVPRALAEAMEAGPGRENLEAFWHDSLAPWPRAHPPEPSYIPMRHSLFSDSAHPNPFGMRAYMEQVRPLFERYWREASGEGSGEAVPGGPEADSSSGSAAEST
jgi:hypothetical protein